MVAQWLFFSKGIEINPAKYPGWSIDKNCQYKINKNSRKLLTVKV